ncbi:MAG: hypothetical protein ABUL55_02330 [Pseudomonadota bacterium]
MLCATAPKLTIFPCKTHKIVTLKESERFARDPKVFSVQATTALTIRISSEMFCASTIFGEANMAKKVAKKAAKKTAKKAAKKKKK